MRDYCFKKENKSFEALSKIDYRQGEKTVEKIIMAIEKKLMLQ